MPSATGEGSEAASEAALRTLAAAEAALFAQRRRQAGRPSLGDAHDAALLEAIGALPRAAASAARDAGQRLGESVYARRYFEDHLPGALAILSASLDASGAGTLRALHLFHRNALVEHTPSTHAAGWHADVRAAALEGVLEGFLGSAFNCAVDARAEIGDRYQIRLREGRDVNRRPSS